MRILLAEDEPKVAQHLRQGLAAEGYAVDLAMDGDEAIWLAKNHPYDVMALDVMMPGKDGFTVVRQLRREHILTPVIFLTARGEVEDRVRGLRLPAVTIIWSNRFRLRNCWRDCAHSCDGNGHSRSMFCAWRTWNWTWLRMRRGARVARSIYETRIHAARISYDVFAESGEQDGDRGTRWDQHFDSETNVVNVYMNHLRRKIDRPGSKPLLHTLRGRGFVIREEEP